MIEAEENKSVCFQLTTQLSYIDQSVQLHLISSAVTTSQLSCSTSAHLQEPVSLLAQV